MFFLWGLGLGVTSDNPFFSIPVSSCTKELNIRIKNGQSQPVKIRWNRCNGAWSGRYNTVSPFSISQCPTNSGNMSGYSD